MSELIGFAASSDDDAQVRARRFVDVLDVLKGAADEAASTLRTPPFANQMVQRLSETHLTFVRRLLRLHHVREKVIGKGLFFDPAWNLLLEAYLAHLEGRRLSISALSGLSGTPATTGLRWIGALTDRRLLERADDSTDKRRCWIRLSKAGLARMEAVVGEMMSVNASQ